MKKTIKYFFIALATIFIFAVFSLLFIVNEADDDSSNKEALANIAIMQITSYYNKNGYYPKNLQNLPVYGNKEFVAYVQKHTFRYSSLEGKKPKYVFEWRGGAMDWTGYRCTNDESVLNSKQEGVIRTYKTPSGAICTVTDLH